MGAEEWVALAEEIEIRLIRFHYEEREGKKLRMILATTPTDAEKYPWSDLAAIYAQRWDIELCLRARFVGGTGSVGSRDFRLFAGNNPCINTGLPGNSRLDPDGTRNDMGAYGGPGAQRFYTSPNDGRSSGMSPSAKFSFLKGRPSPSMRREPSAA